MTQRDALETICSGLVKAVLANAHDNPSSPAQRRHRRSTRTTRAQAARDETAAQLAFNLVPGPSPVPEFGDGAVAPPFTQREYELMEARLRGDAPRDTYIPESGQEPWKG